MSQPKFLVQSSYLSTQDLLEEKDLVCGKIENKMVPDCFLFYLIELNNPADNSKVVKKIVQLLENHMKLTVNEITVERFEGILHAVNEGLGRLSELSDDSWLGNLNAIIGVVGGRDISLSSTGSITGYIFRKNKISAMTERKDTENITHPNKTFSDITSGEMIDNDQIIFGNDSLFNHISIDRLRTLTKEGNIAEEAYELAEYLKKSKTDDANAVLIGLSGVGDEEELTIDEVPDKIVINQPSENFKIFVQNYLIPAWKVIKKYSVLSARYIYKNTKVMAEKSRKEWRENYGPKTGELLKKSSATIKKALEEAKKPQIRLEENGNLSNLKIRAVSYSKFNSKKSSFSFKDSIAMLSNLKILFRKEYHKYLYILAILIILLVAYGKIADNNKKQSQKTHEVQVINALDQAKASFTTAKNDLALGKANALDEFYTSLALAKQAQEAPANKDTALTLTKDIQTIIDDQIKAVHIYDAPSFTLSDSSTHIVLVGTVVYTINSDGKIYLADTRDKDPKLIGSISKDAGLVIGMNYSVANKKILFLTDTARLFGFDLDSNTAGEIKADDGSPLEKSASVATYSTNIYLLDSINGFVWKHIQSATGYGKGTKYIDSSKTTIKSAVDFAIDGNVYVLLSNGTVQKFVKGVPEADFALRNLPKPDSTIATPSKIVTSDEMNSIFVLDKKGNRVIKYDKSGDYANQYIFDGVTIDDFVVNTKLQKIWALSSGKIYEGNL